MQFRWPNLLIAFALTVALLCVLAHVGEFDLRAYGNISGKFSILSVALCTAVLAMRALNYRLWIEHGVGIANWVRLSALHQLLFTLIPSGGGDLSFPLLAKKYVRVSLSEAASVIVLTRIRDGLALIAIGLIGLVFLESYSVAPIAGAIAFIVLAFQLEVLAVRLGQFRFANERSSRVYPFFESIRTQSSTTPHIRAIRTAVSLATWIVAATALWAAFRSVGAEICAAEALILIAAANLSGLVALTIGGLGVSETGCALALVWIGWDVQEATYAALAGRPILLVATLMASGIWILVTRSRDGSDQ